MAVTERIKVIDVDSHVVEPRDLWTSRVSKKWGDAVPHVEFGTNPMFSSRRAAFDETWVINGEPVMSVGLVAMAGWPEYFPEHPAKFEDIVDPACLDARARLKRMDEYGIHAQILYPNVGGFGSGAFLKLKEPDLMLECVRAYNDFLSEWCSADPNRLVAITALPFWDVQASVAEIERCAKLGHKGILFGWQAHQFGQPFMADPYWNPLWQTAQDLGLSINFHIGAGNRDFRPPDFQGNGSHANAAKGAVMAFLGNAWAAADVIVSGLCHRFPKLNFVSVESGVGWAPFLLEALDWQWQNNGVPQEHPEYDLLPSEYFKRQMYACFWFERGTARDAINRIGADNLLYETDFPHPTSMSPGPASVADVPKDFIESSLGDLPEETLRKILHDNAARLYHLD